MKQTRSWWKPCCRIKKKIPGLKINRCEVLLPHWQSSRAPLRPGWVVRSRVVRILCWLRMTCSAEAAWGRRHQRVMPTDFNEVRVENNYQHGVIGLNGLCLTWEALSCQTSTWINVLLMSHSPWVCHPSASYQSAHPHKHSAYGLIWLVWSTPKQQAELAP